MQETLQQHVDCKVDVVRAHVVSEVDLGFGLTHSEHRLDMTHSDWNAADLRACVSDFGVESRHFLLVDLVQLWVHKPLSVHDVLLQDLLVYLIIRVCLLDR